MPAGDDAIEGLPERIEAKRFSAKDVQGKYVQVTKAEYLRAFEDKGDETSWIETDVHDFKAKVPEQHGCEVIGGDGVKFTTT
ncbi:MAG: hypothetical protein M1835_008169 [Candelina submexicana]|nr:MAG: hypothetical protein M1835_008169 [Candelina submexicana]